MPTIIHAERWAFDPETLDTGFGPNHGQDLTTESILTSMDEIEDRQEMLDLDSKLMDSSCYLKGGARE